MLFRSFRALVNGLWSEWTNSTSITLSPKPSVPSQAFEILPEQIIPGQDVEVTLLPVEGITEYSVNVYSTLHISGGMLETIMYSRKYYEPGVVTISAGVFAEPGEYWFYDYAGVSGAPDLIVKSSPHYKVTEAAGGPQLTISAEKSNLYFGEKAEISLGGVQASQVIWEYYRDNAKGDGTYVWAGRTAYEIPAGETVSGINISFSNLGGGTFKVRAMAQVDGQWTDWSNELIFHMSPRGDDPLRNPVPQVTEGAAGEPVQVSWAAAAHAESYQVSWYGNGKSGSLETTDLYAEIPTAELEPGTYTVYITSLARGYENDGHRHYVPFTVEDHGTLPVLNVAIDKLTYDYGESAHLTVSITNADGSTDGLEELYPNASITATLVDAAGEAVPGFMVQSASGLEMSVNFPLADDSMPAGQYRILVETNIPGLQAETELFQYTAERPDMPDLSECSVELTLNTPVFGLNERFTMTAFVTDSEGNPVSGVKVGFIVLDSEGNIADFYSEFDWIWNITKENGQCSLSVTQGAGEGRVLKPATYQTKAFLVDEDTIYDVKSFEFCLDSLHLPASLNTIEAEAFANLDCQAVFIPEGCTSIGERAFADCSQLYYVRIPSDVTEVAENAFEGCPDCIWIDRE